MKDQQHADELHTLGVILCPVLLPPTPHPTTHTQIHTLPVITVASMTSPCLSTHTRKQHPPPHTHRALRKAVDIYAQLEGHLTALGLPIKSAGHDPIPVLRALTAGRTELVNGSGSGV